MAIPTKQRRSIEAIFDLYGNDIPLVMDERLGDGAHYLTSHDQPKLVGCVRTINWARDIKDARENYVPEIYSDEATTWA